MAELAKAVDKLLEANKNSVLENPDKPAYPTNGRMHSDMVGLSKRERFAMAAMQGLVKDIVWQDSITGEVHGADYVAKVAIKIADELLKQLEG